MLLPIIVYTIVVFRRLSGSCEKRGLPAAAAPAETMEKGETPMQDRRLIDELDEIIYVSDPETYELLYMNEPGCKMAGLKPAGYAGLKCYEVLQCRRAPCPFCTNDRLERGKYYVWEHTNPHLGHHYILKDKLIDWKGKPARLELAVDITDKENVSQSLAEKLEIENAMVECIGSLLSLRI